MTAEAFPEHIIYAWSRNGVSLDGEDVARRIAALGPILTVRNASREDSGAYTCVAENDEGQNKVTVTLNVLLTFSKTEGKREKEGIPPSGFDSVEKHLKDLGKTAIDIYHSKKLD
ncbi:nephrin [Trichonephila inaurata madagascariensis]|uniref:Nephrin n=1 Tax=Trichonephila inaurata madagascariensis TaxID=2747483 RepID=A0A8X6X601_9ARAC|nr:nephrin [Trichonephila inaurata madagascariensis]